MQTTNRLMAGGLVAALVLAIAAGPVALADADAPAAPRAHAWGPAAEFHELGLTDAQHAQMKAILEAARPAMQELTQKMRANARRLREITPDDRNYGQVVARVSEENGTLAGKLMAQRAKTYADLYALLAPIQKTHLAEVRAKRAKWLEEHKERGGGHWQHGPAADAEGAPAVESPEA